MSIEDCLLVKHMNSDKKYYVIKGNCGFNDFLCTFLRSCQDIEYIQKLGIDLWPVIQWEQVDSNFWKIFNISDRILNTGLLHDEAIEYNKCIQSVAGSEAINFDTIASSNRQWDYIIRHNIGGAFNLHNLFFQYLCLTNTFRDYLREKYIRIKNNDGYIAIHYRISDYFIKYYKNDIVNNNELFSRKYTDYINKCCDYINNKAKNNKILLCTDNLDIILRCVDNIKIFSFSFSKTLILDKGIDANSFDQFHGIHINKYYESFNISSYDLYLNTYLDYFLMVLSDELIVSDLGQFSKSAAKLKNFLKLEYGNDYAQKIFEKTI